MKVTDYTASIIKEEIINILNVKYQIQQIVKEYGVMLIGIMMMIQ